MIKIKSLIIAFITITTFQHVSAQNWTDSLDRYAREKYMPPAKFHWNWMNASLLYTMVKQYDQCKTEKKDVYLNYIKKAMDKTYSKANGKRPNGVAAGLGMAFLYRVTHESRYLAACEKIYAQYLQIRRTPEGAVSHLRNDVELWDDTIFMIGQFLLEMYQATGDEKYLNEIAQQITLHRDKLQDKQWRLWIHGYDVDRRSHCTFCGQLHWPDKTSGRSAEIWGRGNGWVVVTLADALTIMPTSNPHWIELAAFLKEMISNLPALQNKQNGHWYQLPVHSGEASNYIESSCTAMFAYGIQKAIRLNLVTDTIYHTSADLAYHGLRNYSTKSLPNGYLTTKNVCKGTCIGNKSYYLNRKIKNEKPYSIGMFINLGRSYEY